MNDQLRLSDADRDRAAAALADHYAEGRLSADEHAERLDRVWAARTRADLRPVFRDLPGPARTPMAGPGGWVARGRSFPPLLLVVGLLVVLTVLTHLPFVVLGILAVAFVATRRGPGNRRCGGGTPPAGRW